MKLTKPVSLFIMVLIMVVVTACGPGPEVIDPADPLEQSIINGEACNEGTLPSAVGLIIDGQYELPPWIPPMPIRTVLCTGTLIAPDVVLTAAHCLNPNLLTGGFGNFRDATYYVSFKGDLTAYVLDAQAIQAGQVPEFPDDVVEAAAWIPHPDFSEEALKQFKGGLINLYDVALIFLKEAVDQPEPAVVVTKEEAQQLEVGSKVDIAGWGQQTAAAMNPLQPPPPGTVGQKICAESFINELGDHEMQIGNTEEDSRKCHGDSGGPSYMTIETDYQRKARLVGITSHAYDMSDCAKGGVDTRVDVWLGWIDQMMKDACSQGKRAWCEVEGVIPPSYYEPPAEPDAGIEPDGGGSSSGGGMGPGDDSEDGGGCRMASGAQPLPWLLGLGWLMGLWLVLGRRRTDRA